MTPKQKSPPAPRTPDRKLDDARAMVAKLEAESGAAIQEEQAALEGGEVEEIIRGRTRALASSDALALARARVAEIEDALAEIERTEIPRRTRQHIVESTEEIAAVLQEYGEVLDAFAGDFMATAVPKALALRQRLGLLFRSIDADAQSLGVNFGTTYWDELPKQTALLEKLKAEGANMAVLKERWNARRLSGDLPRVLERFVDAAQQTREVANA